MKENEQALVNSRGDVCHHTHIHDSLPCLLCISGPTRLCTAGCTFCGIRCRRLVDSRNRDIAVCTYSSPYRFRPQPAFLYAASESCQTVRDGYPGRYSCCCAINAVDIFFRFQGVFPHLTQARRPSAPGMWQRSQRRFLLILPSATGFSPMSCSAILIRQRACRRCCPWWPLPITGRRSAALGMKSPVIPQS